VPPESVIACIFPRSDIKAKWWFLSLRVRLQLRVRPQLPVHLRLLHYLPPRVRLQLQERPEPEG